jgi:endoglucanase
VRRDQGGDTVAEGQAYALLLTVATGDRDRFERAWKWTSAHLQRRDGLLRNSLSDPQPAADADLDAARALALAGSRFHSPAYTAAARRIARGVMRSETSSTGGKLVLLPGPWAKSQTTINVSYFSPRTYSVLGRLTGDARWSVVASSSRRFTDVLTARSPGLPPNWARFTGYGVDPIGSPSGGDAPAYGYDAVRTPVRLAESCSAADRRLAARAWPFLRGQSRTAPTYDLDGKPTSPGEHPAALVGAAGAAYAAGDRRAGADLLNRAAKLDEKQPSYYGAAWVALGRVMLQTHELGGC